MRARCVADRHSGAISLSIPASTFATGLLVAALAAALYGSAFATTTPAARYIAASSVDRVTVEHSVCYGSCPAYRIEFDRDGRATYRGDSFVRTLGSYETRFDSRRFESFVDVLYRRGLFVARQPTVVTDVSKTTILIHFTDGTVSSTSTFGLSTDDATDDVQSSATYLDGLAGHFCGWHRVAAPANAQARSGWYSPITVAKCPGFLHR